MRLLYESRKLRLGQALVLDAQLDRDAEAAALARPDRDGAGNRRLGGVLLLLRRGECRIDRAARLA